MKNIIISAEIKTEQINFIIKTFGWMAFGLFVSGITAFKLLQNYYLIQLLSNYIALGVLVIIQIGLVIWLSINIEKIPSNQMTVYFIGFSILNGITIPSIFRLFSPNPFVSTFFIVGGIFLLMSTFGYFTKRDLTVWGSLFLMVFIGICLNIWVNFIWIKDTFQLITSGIAMAIFVGLVAYDTTRIKEFAIPKNGIIPSASLGAFALYLDLYFLFISIIMESNKATKRING